MQQKRPVDIHIGTEKTGSTSIQGYLQLNRQALLADYGLLFPHSLGNNSSTNLAAACQLSSRPDSLRQMRFLNTAAEVAAYYADLAQSLQQEVEASQPLRLLLSCENFSSRLKSSDEIRRLHSFLQPFASSFRVLVYLRRQDEMIASAYTTRIKNGLTRSFRFPEQGNERHDSHFDQLLERWADVFGEDSLCVRLYEPQRLHQGDVVADFCHSLGIPSHFARAGSRKNTALGSAMVEFMRLLNEKVPYRVEGELNPLRGNIVAALAESPFAGQGGQTAPGNVEFCRRFSAGNRRVAQRWFSDDPTVPAELFQPGSSVVAPENRERFGYEQLVDISAHLWTGCQQQLRELRLQRDCLQAELLLERAQLDMAGDLLQRLCREFPWASEPLLLLARLEQRRGNTANALSLARRAAELSPDDLDIAALIADLNARKIF